MQIALKKEMSLIFINATEDDGFIRNLMNNKYQRFRNVYELNDTIVGRINYPTTSTIIITSNIKNFTPVLDKMKSSIRWNHAAYYLIVNRNSKNGCWMASHFLSIIWSYKILSAIYVYENLKNEIFLYTFNPYSNIAPRFWDEIHTDNAITNIGLCLDTQ